MEAVLSIVVGGLFAAGFYMMLRRSVIRLVIGLVLLGQAANLFVFTAAGVSRAQPPLLTREAVRTPEVMSDPLPQALVLTAIVINFGMLAFALVLAHRTHQATGTDDLDTLDETDA